MAANESLVAQVLIVDDEPEHAEVMAEALRKPGHVCTIVNGLAEAEDVAEVLAGLAEPERSDAKRSVESWALKEDGEKTIVAYRHEIDTGFWVPPLIGSMMIQKTVEKATWRAAANIENLAKANRKRIIALND